jgi:histidyl-tRNA synthetase
VNPEPIVEVFIAPLGDAESNHVALVLAQGLRAYQIKTLVDGRDVRLKNKLKRAGQLEAFYSVIIGPDDLARGVVQVRDMDASTQVEVPLHEVGWYIASDFWTPSVALEKLG